MKKNLNFKLIAYILVTTFIISTPKSVYSMDTIKSKAQWLKTKASQAKEKTLDRLVNQYRATRELRHKKAEGAATPAELKELRQRMSTIKKAGATIGVTLITIAAVAASTYAYSEHKKKERVEEEAQRSAVVERTTGLVARIVKTKKGKELTPHLNKAVSEGNIEWLDDLLKRGADPNAKGDNKDGGTILHKALGNKFNPTIVKHLIDAKADLKSKNKIGRTPLHVAISGLSAANPDTIKYLIRAGADPNARDYNGNTPLQIAAWENRPYIVQMLIDGGANPNTQNNDGNTPLQRAAWKNRPENVQILIYHGADPNTQNNDGNTPLHHAATNNNMESIAQLLEAGANPLIRNNKNQLPSDHTHSSEARQLLLDAINRRTAGAIWGLQSSVTEATGFDLPAELLEPIIREYKGETP